MFTVHKSAEEEANVTAMCVLLYACIIIDVPCINLDLRYNSLHERNWGCRY